MRRLIIMLAMASVAGPAMAEPQDGWNGRHGARGEQRQERAADAPRAEAPRSEAPRYQAPQAEAPRAEAPRYQAPRAEAQRNDAPRAEAPRNELQRGNWQQPQAAQSPGSGQAARWRERSEQRRAERASERSVPATRWSDHVRQAPSGGWNAVPVQGSTAPVVRNGSRDGRQWDGTQQNHHWNGDRDGQRWSSQWRRDPRYDWQRYRQHNRWVFNLGSYYDPFGWGYRPLSAGFTLYSGYYRSSFWIDDPWQYRLPPVYGPYRWVRYFDDAVLVDIYSGQVVDVIRDFFW